MKRWIRSFVAGVVLIAIMVAEAIVDLVEDDRR